MSFYDVVGRMPHDIAWWQMCIRAVIAFALLLALIKIGGTRAFGKASAFDIVLGIMLGSTLSRTINGSAPYLQSLTASAALVLMHWIAGRLAFYSRIAGWFVKGTAVQLVDNGHPVEHALRHHNVTQRDLEEALRARARTEEVAKIKDAFLERSGDISIITYD